MGAYQDRERDFQMDEDVLAGGEALGTKKPDPRLGYDVRFPSRIFFSLFMLMRRGRLKKRRDFPRIKGISSNTKGDERLYSCVRLRRGCCRSRRHEYQLLSRRSG